MKGPDPIVELSVDGETYQIDQITKENGKIILIGEK